MREIYLEMSNYLLYLIYSSSQYNSFYLPIKLIELLFFHIDKNICTLIVEYGRT